MKVYYLLTLFEYYIDGHGCADEGSVTKIVEAYDDNEDPYKFLKEGVEYEHFERYQGNDDEEGNEIVDDDNDGYIESNPELWQGSCDGYNRTYETFTIRRITLLQYQTFEQQINDYNRI